jgi:hypothetical protein
VRNPLEHLARGEHLEEIDFDPIPAGAPGTFENPYARMPDPVGLPFGAWCRCSSCSLLGRSTAVFDFYGGAGSALECEICSRAGWGP